MLPIVLDRMMEICRVAPSRFGEVAITPNQPVATMEEVPAPSIKRCLDDPDGFGRPAPPIVPLGAPIDEPGVSWVDGMWHRGDDVELPPQVRPLNGRLRR